MPAIPRTPLLALALALACTPHGEPAAPTETPPPEPTPAPAEQPIAEPTPEPTPAAPIAIGWPSDLREQPKAARKHNSDALRRHRKGDYTGSLAGFDAAIKLAPDFALAHFNRACALTRLGRTADAATVMQRLLAIDLLAFAPRLDNDADLTALRAAPEFTALTTLRSELTTQYAAAVTRGIPTQIYELLEGSGATSQMPYNHKHRAGVWLTDSKTFVPVSPEQDNTFALVWSSDTRTLTTLHGTMTSMYWQVLPADFGVDVYDLSKPGSRLRSHPNLVASFTKLFPKAQKDPANDWEMQFHTLGVRPLPGRTELEAVHYNTDKAVRLELADADPVVLKDASASGWRHTVRAWEGVLVDGMPTGYSRKKANLTVPERAAPINLGKLFKWTQVVLAADNSAAFVLTQNAGCGGRDHRLLRLDLKSHDLRELSTGNSAATLTPALDGSLYFQVENNTRLLAADGTFSDAGLPPWLHVAPPIPQSDCTL